MKSSRIAFAAMITALALACAVPSMAPGAAANTKSGASKAASPAATSAPTGNMPPSQGPIDAQIWPSGDPSLASQALIITDVQLAPDAKLPATIRIPIAPGANVQWAGEVLGGDPKADPQRPYTIHTGPGGGQYAEFNLSKSRRGQIDCAGILLNTKGDDVSFKVDWIQSTEASSALITVRFPAGASRVSIDPKPSGAPATNMQGESLYSLPVLELKPGEKRTITVSYNNNPSGEVPAEKTSAPLVYAVLGTLLVVAFGVLIFQLVKRGRGRSAADEEEGDDDFLVDDMGEDVSDVTDTTDSEAGSEQPSDEGEDDLDDVSWFDGE